MIRKYIIVAEDSINGFDEEIAKLEREWGAEEIEPCEDAISRESLVNELKCGYWNKNLQSAKDDPCVIDAMIDWAIRAIKRQPLVKPQRPQGKWIEQNDTSKHHFGWYYCSNCGAYLMSADGANYCSCCGAEMEGEDETDN